MSIENPSLPIEIPDRHELLAKYAERGDLYTESKPKKKYLNLSDETLSQIVESIDFTPEDLKDEARFFILKEGVLPLELTLEKDEDFSRLYFFSKNNEIGSFEFYIRNSKEGDFIDLNGREISPIFRGKQTKGGMSLGNFAMKVIEKMLANRAIKLNASQKIVVDTGQINVMYWLFNNGFHIPEEQVRHNIAVEADGFYDSSNGKEKWEMISRADERLFISKKNYIYSEEDISELDIPGISKELAEEEYQHIIMENSIRVCLLKDIPVPSPVEETRTRLKAI